MRWLFLFFCVQLSAHPIVIMLAHPRSLSTAFERVMRERDDMAVVHEPFTRLWYIDRYGDEDAFPGHYPKTREGVEAWLIALSKERPVFVKAMSFAAEAYLTDTLMERAQFMVLKRDPIKSLPSMYKVDPSWSESEMGYEELLMLSKRLKISFMLDADDFVSDPIRQLTKFEDTFGFDHRPHAIVFRGKLAAEWEGKWYENVRKEGAIRPLKGSTFEDIPEGDRLKWLNICQRQKELYDGL